VSNVTDDGTSNGQQLEPPARWPPAPNCFELRDTRRNCGGAQPKIRQKLFAARDRALHPPSARRLGARRLERLIDHLGPRPPADARLAAYLPRAAKRTDFFSANPLRRADVRLFCIPGKGARRGSTPIRRLHLA